MKISWRLVEHKKLTRRQGWWAACALLLLLVIWVSKVLSAPQHGKQIPAEQSRSSLLAKPKVKTSPASTDEQPYFSLSLPPGYVQQSVQQPGGNILFSQTIIKASNFGSILINIGIQRLPEGGLEADPSYNLRMTQTDRYSVSHATYNGEPVTLASDLQSAVVVAFWAHGPYIATISASQGIGNPASDGNAEVIKVLKGLLGDWTWK